MWKGPEIRGQWTKFLELEPLVWPLSSRVIVNKLFKLFVLLSVKWGIRMGNLSYNRPPSHVLQPTCGAELFSILTTESP